MPEIAGALAFNEKEQCIQQVPKRPVSPFQKDADTPKSGEMKLSKLEMYITILKAIGQQRLLQLNTIQEKTNLDTGYLKERITFLVEQGLVEQRNTGNEVTYKNTNRGITVLKYFKQHQDQTPEDRFVSA